MKARLVVLRAITMWTAFIAAFDFYLAVMPSTGIAKQLHSTWPPNLAGRVIEHHDRIVILKAAVSAAMAIWWLAAATKPESRPWLRLANAVFSGWADGSGIRDLGRSCHRSVGNIRPTPRIDWQQLPDGFQNHGPELGDPRDPVPACHSGFSG
jgi:hypothetical protein